ncbi:MAG: phosphoribosyltransferase family protein [Candidatus Limiplasma sp.]|nr:phosphoribosyltransferase family protein [Candidatus Limiplasma sp.]MEA5145140.1 phosphoribosyltransferase family protein [Candidatus Limiplasma sp.]
MMGAMQWLGSLFFPQGRVCHACGAPLMGSEPLLCAACSVSLAGHTYPPYQVETVVDADFTFAAAPYRYDGAPAALVKALKFGADHTAALVLAEGMGAAYAAFAPLRQAELCVAVPVHYRRERQRGYNQALVLARAFCALTAQPSPVDAMVRLHHKHSQIGQGREARRRNTAGAFAVRSDCLRLVRGRAILLIDDVLTTGSTAEACAEALLMAGAQQVMLLTACRVDATQTIRHR